MLATSISAVSARLWAWVQNLRSMAKFSGDSSGGIETGNRKVPRKHTNSRKLKGWWTGRGKHWLFGSGRNICMLMLMLAMRSGGLTIRYRRCWWWQWPTIAVLATCAVGQLVLQVHAAPFGHGPWPMTHELPDATPAMLNTIWTLPRTIQWIP